MDGPSNDARETGADIGRSAVPSDGSLASHTRFLELPESTAVNRRREKLWHERCEPGDLPYPALQLIFLGCVAGVVLLIASGWAGGSNDDGISSATAKLPPRVPLALGTHDLEFADTENPVHFVSEAELDEHARKQAADIRSGTEQRLAETDEILIWRLDAWRHPLSTLQDMMVQLAGVGTGGGTWVGHEMERNDLNLETDLIEPHAEALAFASAEGSAFTPEEQKASARRMEQWQSIWKEFVSTAESLRELPETTDFQESHLDSIVSMAGGSHALLSNKLANLKDATAAQAVIDFCGGYFCELRDSFVDDDSPE